VDFFRFLLEMMGLREPEYPFNEPSAIEMIATWVAVVICVVIVCAFLWLPLAMAVHKVRWLIQRERCQHESCGSAWTTEVAEDDYPCCIMGKPCCNECFEEHKDDAAERRADSEPERDCPNGHGCMDKVVVRVLNGHIIMDECADCQGVWLELNSAASLGIALVI